MEWRWARALARPPHAAAAAVEQDASSRDLRTAGAEAPPTLDLPSRLPFTSRPD